MGTTTALQVDYYYLLLSLVFLLPPVLFFFMGKRKADHNGVKLPPGPYAWPVIGNIFHLDGKKPHFWFWKLAESFGPDLFSLRMGSRLVIVASSPRAAREIVKTRDQVFTGRYVPELVRKLPEVDTSMITMSRECNERWRFLRGRAHSELFSSHSLESQSELRLTKVKEMLDCLSWKEGEVVSIADIVYATTANTFTNILVSKDIIQGWEWSQIVQVKTCTRKLVKFGIPGIADMYPAIAGFDFWSKQRAADYMEINKKMWGDIVSTRRCRMADNAVVLLTPPDYLDVLIKNSLDDNEIYNHLIELFLSLESLTAAVEWAMAELTRNQEALVKLGDELAKAFKGTEDGDVLNERLLSKLPYLQACIKETMRLHPPTPFLIPRSPLQNCKVLDFDIPKNCWVVVNAYALGRDPKTWEQPLSFKPERFLIQQQLDLKGTNYELLPFGGGRRMCPGYPLALKLMQLLLASLVHVFDWSLPHGADPATLDMTENFGLTLGRENPLLLIPKKKNHKTI